MDTTTSTDSMKQAQASMSDVAQREAGLHAQFQPRYEQVQKGMEQTMGEFKKTYGEQPMMPSAPETKAPEFHPSEFGNMFGMLIIASAVLGKRSSDPALFAMKALNGMLEGKQQGDMNKYHAELQSYKENVAKLNDNAKRVMDARKQAWAESKGQLDVYNRELEKLMREEGIALNTLKAETQSYNSISGVDKSIAGLALQLAKTNAKLAGGGDSSLDKETLKFMAQQYLEGDKSVLVNLGRGTQGSKNIAALRQAIQEEAKDKGMSPKDVAIRMAEFQGLASAERAVGTRLAAINVAAAETATTIPIARKASKEFSRTDFVPVNKAIQMWESGTGDEKIVRFVAATNAVINTYARAISPSGVPTVSDKDHAREVLNTAQTPEQYNAVLDVLEQEIHAAMTSPAAVKESMRSGMGGTTPSATPSAPVAAGGAMKKLPDNVKLSPGIHTDKHGNKIEVMPDGTYREM